MAELRVQVLLPLPLSLGVLDYLCPPELLVAGQPPAAGSLVRVPFGSRKVIGVIWQVGEPSGRPGRLVRSMRPGRPGRLGQAAQPGSAPLPADRLKNLLEVLPEPPLPDSLCRLIDWIADYVMVPAGSVLKLALPAAVLAEAEEAGRVRPVKSYSAPAVLSRKKLSSTRQAVLEHLIGRGALSESELVERAQVSRNLLRSMAQDSQLILTTEDIPPAAAVNQDWSLAHYQPASLSVDQQAVAAELEAAVKAQGFSKTLLDGVTGSGKTEVYFAAIAAALAMGRQSLVLLPEIALTAQWLGRFRQRFGFAPIVWHSNVSPKKRRAAWRKILTSREGHEVVVGARSALFLPLARLGLIVVDEEHDSSFKQDSGVPYHGRDMAIVRAQIEGIPIILASATPSLETLYNVEQGRYRRFVLPRRHGSATLPRITLIDLLRDPPERGSFLAPSLLKAMSQTLERGEQVALFLNRRGYAPLTLCRACGYRFQCRNCTAWLVEHRAQPTQQLQGRTARLECHQCGASAPVPTHCPECQQPDSLIACGPGVERLSEEVAARFPSAKIAVMASDLLSSREVEQIFDRIQSRDIDMIIGTQIIAKGHHFPYLTLVGVVDADIGLHGGDLRASERCWQLLHQVAGRAGRAEQPGAVYIQTRVPQHPVMQTLAQDRRDDFLNFELGERKYFRMPPYGRLAAVIVSAEAEDLAHSVALELGRLAPRGEGVEVFGPAPAPYALLRGRYRYRLLLKTRREIMPQTLLRQWLLRIKAPAAVQISLDIDPQSFV